MHHGRLNAYVAYVLGFLLIILFLVPRIVEMVRVLPRHQTA